jgi:hypothetical protein
MKENKNQPYVYKLVNKLTDEYYIGYRKNNKHSAEDDLGVYYFSSSKYINKNNFDQYQIFIIEKFDDYLEAYTFEQELIFSNWKDPLLLNESCFYGKKRFLNLPGYKLSDDFRKQRSVYTKGENNPMYGKKGSASPHYGKKRPEHSKRMQGENNPMYGKHHSEKAKIEHSKRMKGCIPHNKGKTYEEKYGIEKSMLIKERLRTANLGKTVQIVLTTCPHCGKTGNKVPMSRWHFENCKLKP